MKCTTNRCKFPALFSSALAWFFTPAMVSALILAQADTEANRTRTPSQTASTNNPPTQAGTAQPYWCEPRADNEQSGVEVSPVFTLKRSGSFVLRSSAVADGGMLPVDYTGDGTGSTLPLEWSGAPAGTKSYVLIMHHIDPEGKTKWYWTLYNVPASVNSLPKNVKAVGTVGNNSVNHRAGYAPPHSKGPGPKMYILTVYALSAPVQISLPPVEVSRDVLLAAMKNLVLDNAELKVVYDRTGIIGNAGKDKLKP